MNDADAIRVAESAARTAYGRLVAILSSPSRNIAAAEDALSDALVAALRTWPRDGVPRNPEAWLLAAARNRLKNAARDAAASQSVMPELERRLADLQESRDPVDRRLQLLFVCAHPAIDAASRTPLMLQTVLGLDASRIAAAFLVPPATMSQRLVRAKTKIRDSALRFELPDTGEFAGRLEAVLDAVYAAFGTGWDEMARSGDALIEEAVYLARLVVALLPQEPEAKGLLALMLYTAARHAARRDPTGRFVPLDRQDSRLWDRDLIIEAEGLLSEASRAGVFGRYQCEAAIQSVHIQRPITGSTNLQALSVLYDLLVAHGGGLGARIARAAVIAEAGEPGRALAILEELPSERVAGHQPYYVARARMLQLLGQTQNAMDCLRLAQTLTLDPAITAYLGERCEELAGHRDQAGRDGASR